MEKNKIIIYTGIKFWHMSEGMHITMAHQFEIFKDWEIHFVFYGKLSDEEKGLVKNKYGAYAALCVNDPTVTLKRWVRKILSLVHLNKFYSLQRPFKIRKKYKKQINQYIKENQIQAVLVNYIWQSDLFLGEDNDCYKIIETHDPQYLFCTQNRKMDPKWPSFVKQEDEIEILSKFDLVLTVSNTDTEYFRQFLKNEIYYLPFTVTANYIEPKKNNDHLVIGFVGGGTKFNYEAVSWFIDNVLVNLDKDKFTLYIYGNVCKLFTESQSETLYVQKGFVDNVEGIYHTCDVMVNPAFISGGIKTKNIECISHGLPLMTTPAGAKGMEEGVSSGALFRSDDPKEWVIHLNALLDSDVRESISKKAYNYACSDFSAEKDIELEKKIAQTINHKS